MTQVVPSLGYPPLQRPSSQLSSLDPRQEAVLVLSLSLRRLVLGTKRSPSELLHDRRYLDGLGQQGGRRGAGGDERRLSLNGSERAGRQDAQ